MTASVSFAEGQAYTWETAGFAWDDVVMGDREVQWLATLSYTASAATSLRVAEGRRLSSVLRRAEAFGVYGVTRKSAAVQFLEGLVFKDRATRQAEKSVSELLSLGESPALKATVAAFEALGVAGAHGKGFEKAPYEALALNDGLDRTVDFAREFSQALEIAGQVEKNAVLLKDKDGFGISDAYTKHVAIDSRRSLSIGETYTDLIGFMLSFVETFSIAERKANEVVLPFADSFGVADGGARNLEKAVLRDLQIAERCGRTSEFTLKLFQLIYMGSAWHRKSTLTKNEYLGVVSKSVRAIRKDVRRALGFYEQFSKTMTFRRYLDERFSLAEAGKRNAKLSVSEFVTIYDGIRRAADMIVSDMILSTEIIDEAGFANLVAYGNVPGYERWRDFIPGDYEYREAMFRTVLESKNSDRGMLASMQVTVDIPDLVERGSTSVNVPAVGGIVTFQRKFHIVPEITMAIRGGVGAPAVPRITSVSTEGFTFVLEDAREGTFTTGVATWAAHGY